MKENYRDENVFKERTLNATFEKSYHLIVFAAVSTGFEWCIENLTEDQGVDDLTVSMALYLIWVGCISASIIFGFGFDSSPRIVLKIWGGVSVLGFLLYLYFLNGKDTRFYVYTNLFMAMS